jgi:hypothetical protein
MLFSPTEPERRRQNAFFSNRTGFVASGLALERLEGLHQEVLQVLKKTDFNFQALFWTYPNIETKYIAESVQQFHTTTLCLYRCINRRVLARDQSASNSNTFFKGL